MAMCRALIMPSFAASRLRLLKVESASSIKMHNRPAFLKISSPSINRKFKLWFTSPPPPPPPPPRTTKSLEDLLKLLALGIPVVGLIMLMTKLKTPPPPPPPSPFQKFRDWISPPPPPPKPLYEVIIEKLKLTVFPLPPPPPKPPSFLDFLADMISKGMLEALLQQHINAFLKAADAFLYYQILICYPDVLKAVNQTDITLASIILCLILVLREYNKKCISIT